MGIDYSGGMLVGASGSALKVPEDYEGELSEFAEDHEMEYYSEHYDAGDNDRYYGYPVEDTLVSEMNEEWLSYVKRLADKFETLFGVPASLIGSQDIY